jgi:hypothetical protein
MLIAFALGTAVGASPPSADAQEAEYEAAFHKAFGKVDAPPRPLREFVSREAFDHQFLGESLEEIIANRSKTKGHVAWVAGRYLASLTAMARLTGERGYLDAAYRLVESMRALRDDRVGTTLWNGKIVPAWSSDTYAQRGQAVFAVHTGFIAAAILEFVQAADAASRFWEGREEDRRCLIAEMTESLAVHDHQWRDGPEPGEGYYEGRDQEDQCEGKPLPANRLSVMGVALWRAYELTGGPMHRTRAEALGRYIRNRLYRGLDGAYYWPYWLDEHPPAPAPVHRSHVYGEDIGHAGLTLYLPQVLAAAGVIFDRTDMERFAKTALEGFARRPGGFLYGIITGEPRIELRITPCRWLALTEFNPEVARRIVPFYTHYLRRADAPEAFVFLLRYA